MMDELTLAAPGAVDDALCLDFECRSALDLRKRGAHVWTHDPSFELLCAAYRLPGDPLIRIWQRDTPVPRSVAEHIAAGRPVRAWNAAFEFECTQTDEARRQGWPALMIEQLDCSMARAAACGLPQGLEECGCVLGLAVKKDVRGMMNMRLIAHPWQSGLPIAPEQFEQLLRYCLTDVAAEIAISNMLPPLALPEQQLWGLHARINDRGIPLDLPLIERAHMATAAKGEEMNARMHEITKGAVPATSAVPKLKKFLGSHGVPGFEDIDLCVAEPDDDAPVSDAPNLQKHTLDVLLGRDDLDPVVREALEIRKSSGKSATKKFEAMKNRVADDGRVRGEFQFCGASNTGRWSSKGLQAHNMKRQPKNFDALPIITDLHADQPVSLENLGLLTRSMIRAPAGQVIVKADYAQIEYRGVCWLAGEKQRLAALERGELPYELLAAMIRGIPIAEVTPDLRNSLGKPVCLGSGYQLGPTGLTNLMARQGREMVEEEARRSIDAFRDTHPAVVQLWAAAESAARKAIKPVFHGCWFPFGDQGCLAFSQQGDWLLLRLPSGRMVRYFKPAVELRERFGRMVETLTVIRRSKVTHQYRRESIYGGLIVENACQAMCRDVLATAMMRLDAAGFDIILHVHDEVVMACDASVNRSAEIVELMTRDIAWLPNFPLEVEVKAGERFS